MTSLFLWPFRENTDLNVLFNEYVADNQNVSEVFLKAIYKIN